MSVRNWILARLPAGLLVRPELWFLAVCCALSGAVITSGLGSPKAVEALLWQPVYRIWGASLLLGSVALMSGLSSIRWAPGTDLYVIRRTPSYRLGLRLLGFSSFAYAIAILIVGHWNGALAAGITLAFSGTCFIRLQTLGRTYESDGYRAPQ